MKSKFLSLCSAFALLAGLEQAAAQDTTVTYQGRVTDNGTNFNGTGEFQFALVTSSNASQAATAIADPPSNGFITGYVVTDGGNGYATPPVVTVSGGGGSGATATATISGGAVTGLIVGSFGNGAYTSAPTATIAPPPVDIAYVTYWSNDGTSSAGSEPAGVVAVGLSNGLFTVVLGDTTLANMAALPSSVFAQPNLQLRIWFSDGSNGFAALSPAQNLTTTPYAAVAASASNLLGNIASANLSGTYTGEVLLNNPSNVVNGAFIGDGSALSNLNPSQFAPGAGFTIQQNSDDAPNVIEGSSANSVNGNVEGGTIGGGGAGNYQNTGSLPNNVQSDFGTIGGGAQNTAGDIYTTVGGGENNASYGRNSTIGGGGNNNTDGIYGTVGGGFQNDSGGSYTTIAGGSNNATGRFYGTVGGGVQNFASGNYSTVSGGQENTASGNYGTIGGGWSNNVGMYATVSGGRINSATGSYATVGGGGSAVVNGMQHFLTLGNTASASFSTVSGGNQNQATGRGATVPGGAANLASGLYSYAAGYQAQATNDGAFVWADDQASPFGSTTSNQFNVRASGGVVIVTSGAGMTLDGLPVLTAGSSNSGVSIQQNDDGTPNVIEGASVNLVADGVEGATIGGGGAVNYLGNGAATNSVTGDFGTVAGGDGNTADGQATIGGGQMNTASGSFTTIGGGAQNTAGARNATVGGGTLNIASGQNATISGGIQSQATNSEATVPGGFQNLAGGARSFAAGARAQATNDGAFVWGDDSGSITSSLANNSVTMRASGGARIFTGPGSTGVMVGAGGTSWSTLSDRNAKKNFQPVNTKGVLEKLAAIPIQQWNYKWEKDDDVPNIGPMAQDFKAAFFPGRDNKAISTLEFDGVELAAIQGLNQKLNEKDAEIEKLKEKASQVDSLQKQLNDLEATVKVLAEKR